MDGEAEGHGGEEGEGVPCYVNKDLRARGLMGVCCNKKLETGTWRLHVCCVNTVLDRLQGWESLHRLHDTMLALLPTNSH